MAASFRWILQLHKDVPKAAKFYSEGLDFTVNVCTLRWAELQSGPLKLALLHSPRYLLSNAQCPFMLCMKKGYIIHVTLFPLCLFPEKGYSSVLSFTVTDINSTVTKLMALGAELDGPIKYEIHGKVAAMRCLDGHIVGLHEPV